MATLATGQRALMYALAGVMRAGASRANFVSPSVFVAIDDVQYATARDVDGEQVDDDTLEIHETEGATPNTASFTVRGFQPTNGQRVVVMLGSINNFERLFAGTILTDAHGFVGHPSNGRDVVNAIDDTWQLTRRTITQRFTNASGTAIAQAIIALAPGFTSLLVEAGLPTVDEISFTNRTLASALAQLCERIGATYKVSTNTTDVQLGFTANAAQTDPTPLTEASALLTEMTAFSVTRDRSQLITRQPVEGGGSNAFYAAAVGATSLAVVDDSWYNAAGGMVVSGPQRITYTGIGSGYTFTPSDWQAQSPGFTYGNALFTGVVWAEALALWVGVFPSTSSLDGVMTSPDGIAWTVRAAAAVKSWASVAWSASLGVLVAVATNNGVMTSPDGITWTARTAAEDSTWQDVVWAEALGLFVAVADTLGTGTHLVMTSPTGVTWTARTAASANQWYRVAWSPALGLLAAVSTTGATTAIMTSPDGSTWTTRTTTAVGVNVAWSPTLNLFVKTNTTAVETSPTGVTWTNHAAVLPSATYNGLVWADLGYFVALSGATSDQVAVSTDGLTWATYSAPLNTSGGRWAIAWSPTRGQFVAGGFTGALVSKLMSNSALFYHTLTGIPASGVGSILYAIPEGEQVNLRVEVDDLAAQAVMAALLPQVLVEGVLVDDDGIIEGAVIQDGRISETEAIARGTAQLELRSTIDVSATYVTHDGNTHAARTAAIDLPAPTSVTASFKIQSVTIGHFRPARYPTRTVQCSNRRFTLADLLRQAREARN